MSVSLEQICKHERINTDIAEYFMQKKGIQTAHELSIWLKNECVLDMIVSHFAEGLSLWPDTP